MIPVFDM
jgi:predicted amidohydrolase YtcJ